MKNAKVWFEIDFTPKNKPVCGLCGNPFLAHFQPPHDADWDRAAHWCPTTRSNGKPGFTSMTYRAKTPRTVEVDHG